MKVATRARHHHLRLVGDYGLKSLARMPLHAMALNEIKNSLTIVVGWNGGNFFCSTLKNDGLGFFLDVEGL